MHPAQQTCSSQCDTMHMHTSKVSITFAALHIHCLCTTFHNNSQLQQQLRRTVTHCCRTPALLQHTAAANGHSNHKNRVRGILLLFEDTCYLIFLLYCLSGQHHTQQTHTRLKPNRAQNHKTTHTRAKPRAKAQPQTQNLGPKP